MIIAIIFFVFLFAFVGYFALQIACFVASEKQRIEHRRALKEAHENNPIGLFEQKDNPEIARNQYDKACSTVFTNGTNKDGIEETTYAYNNAVDDVSVINNTELDPYFDILNMSVTISEGSVKKAFREMAKKYHPLYGTEPDKDKYDEIVIAKDKLLAFYSDDNE